MNINVYERHYYSLSVSFLFSGFLWCTSSEGMSIKERCFFFSISFADFCQFCDILLSFLSIVCEKKPQRTEGKKLNRQTNLIFAPTKSPGEGSL